jgi:hypothetical protein
MHIARYYLALGALLLSPSLAPAQAPTDDYRAVSAAFARQVVVNGDVIVASMELGPIALDTNRFTALVTNNGDAPRSLGLNIRAVPGLWVASNWLRSYRFEVAAHSERRIEAAYVFRRMTPEASLRVAIGTPVGTEVTERFFDTTLAIGHGNPAATDLRKAFDTLSTEHFELYAWRGSLGAMRMPAIATDRERALQRIAELLSAPFTGKIRLVLYPDSASKTTQTGHVGAGFANNRTIVEIYNDSVQLDPYHEVAHIVAAQLGSPPAMLDEGFAVYVAELLGADALKYLGAPGKTVSQVTCGYLRSGQLIPLTRLFRFTDIGSDSTSASISYPESASFTGFLIDRYGSERFRDAYGKLRNTTNAAEQAASERLFAETYGHDLAAVEREWKAGLTCSP